jgi:hypothetical protein
LKNFIHIGQITSITFEKHLLTSMKYMVKEKTKLLIIVIYERIVSLTIVKVL